MPLSALAAARRAVYRGVLRFGGKKPFDKARKGADEVPAGGRSDRPRLSLQQGFPTGEVSEAIAHLLKLANRVAALSGSQGGLAAEMARLRAEAGKATLPEDYQQLCREIGALEWGNALSRLEGGVPSLVLSEAIEAVLPVARAIRGDGPGVGLQRLLQEADNPRGDARGEYFVQMERLAESVAWLRAASDVFKVATLDVLAALGRLTGDEGRAKLRLVRLRDGIDRAGNINDLHALRESLLQEANSMVEEASLREGRLIAIHEQVDSVQAHVATLENALADANQMALTDPLTGLGNRRALDARVKQLADSARATGVLALDIDHFKRVNDSYGHDAGDLVIRKLSDVMRQALRGSDAMFRVGGEEFCVLLPDADAETSCVVAERIRERFAAAAVHCEGRDIQCTVSIGVAVWSEKLTFKQVRKDADEALYKAKHGGRDQIHLAS